MIIFLSEIEQHYRYETKQPYLYEGFQSYISPTYILTTINFDQQYNSLIYNNNYIQQQMCKIQRLVQLFQQILTPNNDMIKNAHRELQALNHDDSLVHNLLEIPLLKGVDEKIIKFAISYSRTVVKSYIIHNDSRLMNNGINKMFSYLQNSNIPFQSRYQVAQNLQFLIKLDKQERIIAGYQPNLIILLNNVVDNNSNSINFEYVVLMCKVLADSVVSQTKNPYNNFFDQTFIPISKLAYRLFQYGSSLNPQPATMTRFLLLCSILSGVLKKYIKRFYFYNAKVEEVLYNPIFPELVINALAYGLPENELSTSLIYYKQNQQKQPIKLLKHYYELKSNYTYILKQSMGILITSKTPGYREHPFLTKGREFVNSFTYTLKELLQKIPYYKMNNISLTLYLQEIIQYISSCIRNNHFYKQVYDLKHTLQYIIFQILAFSYDQYKNFNNQPQQFLNSLIHTIQMDQQALFKAKNRLSNKDDGQQIEQYGSLKSVTAGLLKYLCKYVDGTITQLFQFSQNVLTRKINSQYSPIRVMVVLAIMRDETQDRQGIKVKIANLIFNNLKDLDFPNSDPQNMQFSMNLILLWRYFFYISDNIYDFYHKVYLIIEQILKNTKLDQVPKLIACEIIMLMTQTKQSQHMIQPLLRLLNGILSATKIYKKYVECLQNIIENNDQLIVKGTNTLSITIEKTGEILKQLLMNSSQKQIIIEHLWNILLAMSNSHCIVNRYRMNLYQVLEPISNMINGDNQLDIDSNYFKIIGNMIKNTAIVTKFDLQIIKILPQVFYKGKQKYQMNNAFEPLQMILFHGIQILKENLMELQALIILCIESMTKTTVNGCIRTQADYCQGLLILQTIIIQCNYIFTEQIWAQLRQSVLNVIYNVSISSDFFLSNLISTLTLILVNAHKRFTTSDNQNLITVILNKYTHYSQEHSSKIFVITMAELLTEYSYPYIQNHYIQIFDSIITLLKISATNKAQMLMDCDNMNDEQRDFDDLKKRIHNRLIGIDQFIFFRNKIEQLRSSNPQVLEHAVKNLPNTKIQYYKQVSNMQKVNNQARKILKIKRNPIIYNNNSQTNKAMQNQTQNQPWSHNFSTPQTINFN